MSLSASGKLDAAMAPGVPPSGCQAEVLEQTPGSALRPETFPTLSESLDVCQGPGKSALVNLAPGFYNKRTKLR